MRHPSPAGEAPVERGRSRVDAPSPRERIVWVLNLDADDELAAGARYRPPEGQRATRIARFAEALASLVGDAIVLPPAGPLPQAGAGAGAEPACFGRAFSPTPSALARLRAASTIPPRAPDVSILRRVNHRAFSAELGQTLEGAAFVRTDAHLEAALGASSTTWVLKRPFGFVGRGQRRIGSSHLTAADRAWIAASLATGEGLQVEPWVERLLDVGQHGYLFPDGDLVLGAPTIQTCTATGAWTATHPAVEGDLAETERAALEREARRAAEALTDAGYFGPFGIDAFRFRDERGSSCFQPRSEINARYSMGWSIGLGAFRPPPGLP